MSAWQAGSADGRRGIARAGAVPGQTGDRRAGRAARADGRRPLGPGPPAGGGRSRAGQDAGGEDLRGRAGRRVPAHPVHARPGARRHRRHEDLQPEARPVRGVARPDLRQPGSGRRDQPGAGQGAERAAGGDAGAPGHDRPGNPPPARSLPRHGDPEPDRIRRDLPAPRGPGRPVHAQGAGRLPDRDRGVRHRRADDRRPRNRCRR